MGIRIRVYPQYSQSPALRYRRQVQRNRMRMRRMMAWQRQQARMARFAGLGGAWGGAYMSPFGMGQSSYGVGQYGFNRYANRGIGQYGYSGYANPGLGMGVMRYGMPGGWSRWSASSAACAGQSMLPMPGAWCPPTQSFSSRLLGSMGLGNIF